MCHVANYTETKGELVTELRELWLKCDECSLAASEAVVKFRVKFLCVLKDLLLFEAQLLIMASATAAVMLSALSATDF